MTPETPKEFFKECLRIMLAPIVRFALRHACTIQDIIDVLKICLVEVAAQEMAKVTPKINVSRISAMTGLTRRDVDVLFRKKGPPPQSTPGAPARVLGQWLSDKRFINSHGQPRVLSYEGENSEFRALCESISTNLHPGTVLFELERSGAVERTSRGLKVRKPSHRFIRDPKKGYNLLARDVELLISAAEDNIHGSGADNNLHIHTEYDNLSQESLERIRIWFLKNGRAFHRRAREFLSKFDKDIHPDIKGDGGGRAVIGSFSLVSPKLDSESGVER